WNDMMLVSDKLDANGKPLGTLGHGEMWFHTDKCYHRRPHRVSFLYGIEIPSAGGHTKFSSMYAAYDRLPADLKRRLGGAMVMQGQQYGVGRRIDVTLPLESTHHCRQPIFVTTSSTSTSGGSATSSCGTISPACTRAPTGRTSSAAPCAAAPSRASRFIE